MVRRYELDDVELTPGCGIASQRGSCKALHICEGLRQGVAEGVKDPYLWAKHH